LNRREDLELHAVTLQGGWRWIHLRTVPFLLRAYLRLRKLIRYGDLDAVLFSSMVTATLVLPLAPLFRRYGTRSLAIVHGLDVTTPFGPYQRLVRRVFESIDLVLPVSRATGEACMKRGLPESRMRVIHNGVDCSRFPDAPLTGPDRKGLFEAFEVPESAQKDRLILCSVGRQVRRKGYAWFIAHVLPRLPAHIEYWLAGDGPENGSIREAVHANGLDDRVRLLGKVSEESLQALYRGADLFVMPNIFVPGDMEGFGIVMLEAGMNAMPSVAARLEGIAEVIEEGENGVFVPPEDADAYVRALLEIDSDRDGLLALRRRARVYTESTFGWARTADRYLAACAGRES
jgi:phosphatidylinositol alpha-1,6-mannosyltransferase